MNIVRLFPVLFLWAVVFLTSVEVVCADEPLLESAGIQSTEERNAVDEKGVNTSESSSTKLSLTPEEQAWLAHNYTVQVRVTNHKPYLFLIDGKPVGIAVDFIEEISERTGIKFHFVMNSPSFSIDLKRLMEHTGPDMISTLMPTLEREKVILFTQPYINSPRFIFTRDDTPFVSSIEKLFGEKVAVVKDYVTHKTLVEMFPAIDLLVLNNNEAALRAVSSGEAIAFIGDLVSTPAMINEFGLNHLKVVSPSGLPDHPLAMGIRNDWPELQSILNKGLAAIPAAEKAAIINKWSSVKFDHGITPAFVWTWVLIIATAVSGALGVNVGIFGNVKKVSVYFSVPKDGKGELFDGSKHNYSITFAADQIPPAKNFWSWTMYKLPQRWLVDNPINRYAIGSATPGLKKAKDGSITIYFQARSPGKDKESNWLPAPEAPFWIVLRTYGPGKSILDGSWKLPQVKQVN
jgi:ABC-type amino acid transport substrate-binding protein